jgi:diadenosine tetraphosphate (Ap4A) HIT family hydrolase
MAFALHSRLATGAHEIGRIGASRLLLKNHAMFPWFLLVPEAEGLEDLHELEPEHYFEVMAALRRVSEFVMAHFEVEKLNIGCIGNQVRQLHLHIVGRSSTDPAWPKTVWAFEEKKPYGEEEIARISQAARDFLGISG